MQVLIPHTNVQYNMPAQCLVCQTGQWEHISSAIEHFEGYRGQCYSPHRALSEQLK